MEKQTTEDIINGISQGLLNWYDFKPGSRILYVGEKDSYAEVLEKYAVQMMYKTCAHLRKTDWPERFYSYFDYIVCVEALERESDPEQLFAVIRKSLKQEGIFLAAVNNRLGLRYFCGDRDPYTNRNFDGIENYRRAYVKKEDAFHGRMYDREQLKKMLLNAGWKGDNVRFFSVLTDLRNPSFIYAQDFLPNEDLSNRVFPTYCCPDTVFMDEEPLYQSLMENGMFHQMANAYLIECSAGRERTDVIHVTSSMERGREDALLTVMHRSGIVEKRAGYPEGAKRLEQIAANAEALRARGLAVVETRMINDSMAGSVCRMPYINAETGQLYLKRLLRTDRAVFLKELDHFRDLILLSSETAPEQGDGAEVILKNGFLDLVPLNSFYADGEFMFFDQEFCQDNCPLNLLIHRMISTLYAGDSEMHKLLPIEELYERYGIAERRQHWQETEWEF